MDKVSLSDKKYIAIFVLPTLLLYLFFVFYPVVYNMYISMFKTDLMSINVFVGFKNYALLFQDQFFLTALKNNGLMICGSFLAHMLLGLFFANALFHKIKGSEVFQSVFFSPVVISGASVGIMFSFVYNSEFGLVNKILELLSLSHLKMPWLSSEKTVMPALIFVVMWRFVGYHMIIQLAAMKGIPVNLYEASELDGASQWQQFTMVTFPLIKHILKIDLILIITGSLRYYDLVAVMTKGGPNHASEVMSTYMFYQAFRTLKFGYSSTIGMIIFVLSFLVIGSVSKLFKTESIEY